MKTPNNEVSRNELSYKERIEFFEKRAKEFFESYENPTGSEDRLEVCLIRDGRRAVAKAKEEINRLNNEIEGLKRFKAYFESLFGMCIETVNFPEKGSSKPFDEFYNEALMQIDKKPTELKRWFKRVEGNIGTNNGFVRIINGNKGETICLVSNGTEDDVTITLDDCLKLIDYDEENTCIVIFDGFTKGEIYYYGNYGPYWTKYGETKGFV